MKKARALVLGILQQGELYGYQIKKMFQEERFSTWATLPIASLYHELNKMAEEGLIERVATQSSKGRPARTIYRITERGRQELSHLLRKAWLEMEPPRSSQDIAVFFMNSLPEEEVLSMLRERLAKLKEKLRCVERALEKQARQAASPSTLRAVLDHAQLRIRGEIEWTQHLIRAIEKGEFRARAKEEARRASLRKTKGIGAFTFVLHSHLPYCRMAGQWPHGEEWLHEALAETYIPLLNALYDLKEEGVPFKLTLSLTPVLTEQLADPDVRRHFLLYLDREIEAARRDILRFGEMGDAHLEYLAAFYRDYYLRIKESFLQRFAGDVILAFKRLQDEGYVEIVTSAATHGYLPLLARDSSIYGQLRTGVESYKRFFGRSPRAIWLPECAYRPAYHEDGLVRPALEEFLAPLGLTCFFVETHAIEGGRPVGKAAGEVAIGPYSAIRRRYVIPIEEREATGGTTYSAYYVVGSDKGLTDPPVAVIGRNNRTGQQVWSADWGYPGDADYREFHKKDGESGLQYWRVTGPKVDLGGKDYYHPDWAEYKVEQHAQHFASLVEDLLRSYHEETSKYGIVSANYDTELFGHWWFEGIEWIKRVLRKLAQSDVVDLVTASEYVEVNEPEEVIALPESSWGAGGTHWTWDNPKTHWMWEPIHRAEKRMEKLVQKYPAAQKEALAALNQAARELLLLQASDWPFLVTTGQAKEYAEARFKKHLERFHRLADLLEQGDLAEAGRYASKLYELDKIFPHIDYRWFAPRQGNPQ